MYFPGVQLHLSQLHLILPVTLDDNPKDHLYIDWLLGMSQCMRVTEADLRPRPVTVPQLADDLRQVMFTVITVVPANDVQLRQTVVRDLLSRVFKR